MIIEFYYTPDGLEPPSDVSIDFSDSSDEFNPFATRYLMKTLHLETPSYIDGDLCELVFSCSVIDGSIIEWDSRH